MASEQQKMDIHSCSLSQIFNRFDAIKVCNKRPANAVEQQRRKYIQGQNAEYRQLEPVCETIGLKQIAQKTHQRWSSAVADQVREQEHHRPNSTAHPPLNEALRKSETGSEPEH